MPKSQPTEEVYRLNAGRVFIRPIKIAMSGKSDGKYGKAIDLPESAEEAERLGRGVYDAHGRMLKADTSCAYGRVVASGEYANRSTTVPVKKEDMAPNSNLRDFPLPVGTYVVISGSVIPHKVDPFEEIYSYNASELQRWWLPSDPKPKWAPEE